MSCTMVKISVWKIVTDSYDSVTFATMSSIVQYFIYLMSCTMVKISVWKIVTDSYDSVTLFMDLETRGVTSSNRLLCSPRRFV